MMNDITHADHDRRIATVYPSILMVSGRVFDFTNPGPITVEEAAASLSKLCRFTGHCREFYSVAQHSLLVSLLLPHHLALQGLLHDAVEAVLGDMSGPLKKVVPGYKALEARTERVILAGFGLPEELHPLVKRADLIALKLEKEVLMYEEPGVGSWDCIAGLDVGETERNLFDRVLMFSPQMAEATFVSVFYKLQAR